MEFRKPFALLMTLACLNDKYPMWSFYERRLQPQILKFDEFATHTRDFSHELVAKKLAHREICV